MANNLTDKIKEEKVLVADPDKMNQALYTALIEGVNRQTGHNYVPIIASSVDKAKKAVDENPDIERAIINMYFSKETVKNQFYFEPNGMEIVDHIRFRESLFENEYGNIKISIPIIATGIPPAGERNTDAYRQIAEAHGCDMFLDIPFKATDFVYAMNMIKLPAVDNKQLN